MFINIRAFIVGIVGFMSSYIAYVLSDDVLNRIVDKGLITNPSFIAANNTIINYLHYSLVLCAGVSILYIILNGLIIDTKEDLIEI